MKRITTSGTTSQFLPRGGLVGSQAVASVPLQAQLYTATSSILAGAYPFRLSLYEDPPTYEITIEEFEELAIARLELLRNLETAIIRNLRDEELFRFVSGLESKFHLNLHSNESARGASTAALGSIFNERRRDQASHFILRLAFCSGNPDTFRWFVVQECALFKIRFQMTLQQERSEFLQSINSDLSVVPPEEKDAVKEFLLTSSTTTIRDFYSEEFLKVPFELVPDLVGKRGVYLKAGWAYVPRSESFSIVLTRFREQLEHQLERTAKELPMLKDDRVLPLLELIKRADTSGTDASRGFIEGSTITSADIDKALVHFPLCMQHLHRKLRQDSHLRYGGRQQYGLFLKSIGLSLEEALAFWRRSFAAKAGEDSFQKNYAYNIRHNYGQEGKRANYSPFSCTKIITSNQPGPGDHHGCPFRHFDLSNLQASLVTYTGPTGTRLSPPQLAEIVDLVKAHHYQVACTKLFEYTRASSTGSGNHATIDTIAWPSKFYEASVSKLPSKKHN